jgi:phosphohistidine phosphatase SixA
LAKKFDLKNEHIVPTDHLAPAGYADQLIEEMNEKYGDIQNIALIGHQPYLGSLASTLITGDPNASIILKKGGVCRLSSDRLHYARCATLDWLLSPAQLAELGD